METSLFPFKRPLVPILSAFIGGIILSSSILPHECPLALPGALVFFFMAGLFTLFRPYGGAAVVTLFLLAGIILESGQHRPSRMSLPAAGRVRVILDGTVAEPPKTNETITRLNVLVHGMKEGSRFVPVNENVRVTVYSHPPDLKPGHRIRFPARLRLFRNFRNPGRYDYERAMELKGFACGASVSDGRNIVPMGTGALPIHREIIESMRRPTRAFLEDNFPAEDAALLRALILGERQAVAREWREIFNRSGLGHLLAVSGLHIGLAGWIAFLLFFWILSRSRVLPLKMDIRKAAALLTCLPVIAYTCLAGLQVSSQRAMVMALAYLFSIVLGRERDVWSTLALAALVILALDPRALFSASFLLSFGAVFGILWLTPPLLRPLAAMKTTRHGIRGIAGNLSLYAAGLVAASLCATLFLLPMLASYFHRVSLVAVPANVSTVPFMGLWIIPSALLGTLSLTLSEPIAVVFYKISASGLHLMMDIIRFWAGLNWSSLWIFSLNLYETTLYYGLLFCLFFFRRGTWAKAGLIVLILAAGADAAYWIDRVHDNQDLRVTFYDVGQGNAALVEFPFGKKMLIDGGGFPGSDFDVGRMVLAPALWHSKITSLDYLVLSHPQADHMKGLGFMAEVFHPGEFWSNGDRTDTECYRRLMEIIRARGIQKHLPGDLARGVTINGARVEVLHPFYEKSQGNRRYGYSDSLNNNSLVLKITCHGQSFLFPGDIEKEAESALAAEAGEALDSDILLSPHHGSRSSSTKEFLHMVRPKICVISSGYGNFFGFPHARILMRLREIGCRTIRTDRAGAVRCSVAPEGELIITTFVDEEASRKRP